MSSRAAKLVALLSGLALPMPGFGSARTPKPRSFWAGCTVKCLQADKAGLTVGQHYIVERVRGSELVIINDEGQRRSYGSRRFRRT